MSSITTTISHIPSASDTDETKFLTRTRTLRHTRLCLAILTVSIAIPTIACEAIAYHHYRQTASYSRVWLYLWPLNLDLRPTIAVLACGSVIALQNLIYVVVALIPSPHPHIRRLNLLALSTSLAGFLAALIGLIFVIYRPGAHHPSGFATTETLHSWTCKWEEIRYGGTADSVSNATFISTSTSTSVSGSASGSNSTSSGNGIVAGSSAPSHFRRDCDVTRAAFIMLGVLLGLEIVMGVVAGVGVWVGRRVERERERERGSGMGKSEVELELVEGRGGKRAGAGVEGGVEKYPGT
ncbi:hypothetical protein BO70DRAFT_377186 [Aspergillus heteromorphus CBS 117.55]|uniref:Uncharacterized protein n=1 Tax=Aspergillus heteromorphus CBS 117.55 TaxID=1448321 RepID=A0A317WXB4_9EURO|nr:uncharacterized protein BO70DRAFT_377186 [Aspergillus heteromorphus CBS 117.55]PWY89972.1 hypothetical protein BO70DRAFT_377186 [Aspergillus heteromorphus CBS 117.55]